MFDVSSPHERLALAYLRVNERLYNRDYVRLTACTSVEATQALRRMVDKGVLAMQGTRSGAYYVLPEKLPEPPPSLLDAALTDEERILQLAQREGRIKVGQCMEKLGLSRDRASKLLQRLTAQGHLQAHGRLTLMPLTKMAISEWMIVRLSKGETCPRATLMT